MTAKLPWGAMKSPPAVSPSPVVPPLLCCYQGVVQSCITHHRVRCCPASSRGRKACQKERAGTIPRALIVTSKEMCLLVMCRRGAADETAVVHRSLPGRRQVILGRANSGGHGRNPSQFMLSGRLVKEFSGIMSIMHC